MKIYRTLSELCKEILPTGNEVELVAPEAYSGNGNEYAFDVLRIDGIEQRSGRGIIKCNVNAVIFLYIGDEDFDDMISLCYEKLSYNNLQTFLNLHNEVIAINVEKIVCYKYKKTIALHLSLLMNAEEA